MAAGSPVRDFAARQPEPTPLLPLSPFPLSLDAEPSTRLRVLPHRTSLRSRIAVEHQQKAKKQKLAPDNSSQPPQAPVIPFPLFNTFEAPTLTDTRLRSLPNRDSLQGPPLAHRPNRKLKEPQKQDPKQIPGQQLPPPPKQVPPGYISVSTLLSESDTANEKEVGEATMPVALRRPSTTQKTRSNSNEKGSHPNGTLTKSLVNGHSPSRINKNTHAHNHALSNGSLGSMHTHPPPTQPPSRTEDKDRERALERNIDNVVFGEAMFKAWYPSWYPKEIIGEKALDGKSMGTVVQKLYVCKRCFGYGKEVHDWVRHCQVCEKEVPGVKVYDHGHGAETVWSVWEVDGGVDNIFCQNLSLFAKLFLDNKSVFFDVSGFNYFLLVHNPTSQIIGFFSKEKMSWDNNNLACILIFPPWQRKGLGSILMGVSYEISRREEILGGPEKPISDLGKRGYKMFWGREIARWLLECKETDRKKGKGVISVKDVSLGTWIHGDDCLGVLREMGIVERAGKGRGDVERVVLDKVKVREWVERMGLDLDRVVDSEGFIEGYGYKELVEEQVSS